MNLDISKNRDKFIEVLSDERLKELDISVEAIKVQLESNTQDSLTLRKALQKLKKILVGVGSFASVTSLLY